MNLQRLTDSGLRARIAELDARKLSVCKAWFANPEYPVKPYQCPEYREFGRIVDELSPLRRELAVRGRDEALAEVERYDHSGRYAL